MQKDNEEEQELRTFKERVDDERERLAIRNLLDPTPKKSRVLEILSYPITLTIVGFLLTGVLGAGLTYFLQERAKAAEVTRAAVEKLRDFHALFEKRRSEAAYFDAALKRRNEMWGRADNDPQKIYVNNLVLSRKASYDDSVKEWNVRLLGNLMVIREDFGSGKPVFIEGAIYNDLLPTLQAVDQCLDYHFYHPVANGEISCSVNIDSGEGEPKTGAESSDEPDAYGSLVTFDESSMPTSGKTVKSGIRLLGGARQCGDFITGDLFLWIPQRVDYKTWEKSVRRQNIRDYCRKAVLSTE